MALSEARRRVYDFMSLPEIRKIELAKAAGVFCEDDEPNIYTVWINRAKEKGTLDVLMPKREQPQGEATRDGNWLGKVMEGATKRHEAREELERRLSYNEPFVKPASPPAPPAGGAREFVIEWAKQRKETYLQVDDIAACAEAFAKTEREARERAEKALREFGQHHCNCNQAEVNSGCTCGFERVLAALKSSEGAK